MLDPVLAELRASCKPAAGSRTEQLIREIAEGEEKFEREIRSAIGGYTVLADCFRAFVLETLDRILTSDLSDAPESYGLRIVEAVIACRGFRAAEQTFRRGYPLAGLVLLRDLKDRGVFNSAIAQGITSFQALWATSELDDQEDQDRRLREARKSEEMRVMRLMLGKQSGLSPAVQSEIDEWHQFFHLEVHGSRLSFASELGPWLRREEALSFAPQVRESSTSAYFNRATEVAWLWHRLLPTLFWNDRLYDEDWERRWTQLEDAFRHMEQSLEDLGKQVASAFCVMIDAKFPFAAGWTGPSSVNG